ncbi:MAG: hypothetical protein ACHQUC_00910 [Chlamydiales bacterium]
MQYLGINPTTVLQTEETAQLPGGGIQLETDESSSLSPIEVDTTHEENLIDQFADGLMQTMGLPVADRSHETEVHRIRMEVAAQFVMKELKWDTSLDSMQISEAVVYEFCSLFDQIRALIPNKINILFIQVYQTLSTRPFHKKNKNTMENFLKILRSELGPREKEVIDGEIEPRISSLKFICSFPDFSTLTVGTLRYMATPLSHGIVSEAGSTSSSSSSSEIPELGAHLYPTWKNFGSVMDAILKMLKSRIQAMEERFAAKDFVQSMRTIQRRGNSADIFLNKWEEICNKILNTQKILISRGKVVNDLYRTILEALEMKLAGSRQILSYHLPQLLVHIKLLNNLIDQLNKLIEECGEGVGLTITEIEIKRIYDEVKAAQSFFLDDEEDTDDHLEVVSSLGTALFSNVKAQIQTRKTAEMLKDQPKFSSSMAEVNSNLQQQFTQLMTLTSGMQKAAESLTELSKSRKETRQFVLKKFDKQQKERRLQPYQIKQEQLFRTHLYKDFVSANEEIKFCQASLKPLLGQIEKFSKQFGALSTSIYRPEDVAALWPLFSDKQEEQKTVSRMKKPAFVPSQSSSSSTSESLIDEPKIESPLEIVSEALASQSVLPIQSGARGFLQQFNQLQFTPKLSDLTAGAPLTSFQSQIIRSCFQDAAYHTSLLGAAVDLIGRSLAMEGSSFDRHLPHIARVMARTTSTLSEQFLSAELFARNHPDATLEHSHILLGRFLENEIHQPLTTEDKEFLKSVDYGVVAHRFPINMQFLRHQALPILKWIQTPEQLSLGEIQQTILATLHFLNRHGKIGQDNLSALEMALQKAFHPSEASSTPTVAVLKLMSLPKMIERAEALLNRIQRELSLHAAPVKIEIHDRWLNAEYHLRGLKESLECLRDFPQSEFLLLNGDMIIMHLQHLDELIEGIIHHHQTKERLNIHDLEVFRSLRGHRDTPKDSAIVAAFNNEKGDHYPHRYRTLLQSKQGEKPLPAMTSWRLDTYAITPRLSDFADGFTPVTPVKLKSPQQLCNSLLESSSRMIDLLSLRLTKLRYQS